MAKRDLYNSIGVIQSIAPAVQSASVNGSSVDLRPYNSATVIINAGAIVGAAVMVPKLQESDDNSTFTDVAAGDLLGAFPASLSASASIKVGYKGTKRYVRPVLTLSSGTSIAADAVVIGGHASLAPVA